MRVVLLLLVLLMLAPSAEGARWKQRSVVVFDYSGPEWRPYVLDAVNHFNAALPKRAPRLELRQMSEPCKPQSFAISICVTPREEVGDPYALGMTNFSARKGAMSRAFIKFAEDTEPTLSTACHELFHAMGVGSHGEWVKASPCPYDEGIMRKKYRRERVHR